MKVIDKLHFTHRNGTSKLVSLMGFGEYKQTKLDRPNLYGLLQKYSLMNSRDCNSKTTSINVSELAQIMQCKAEVTIFTRYHDVLIILYE
jgi:hypothetical protein